MISVFTICSNNYLAQAKALGDSLVAFNPNYKFLIFLVDKLIIEIDYTAFKPYDVIPVDQIGITDFDEMVNRYDITELNTSVKPFIFDYMFNKDENVEAIIYFDPDILIYEPLNDLENGLHEFNIILTPHFFTPIYDNHLLSETGILNSGLYNLGFIAVRRNEESDKFLNWWMIKLKDQCYIDFQRGLFVDQLWINFVPLYFEKVFIVRDLGYNVAYWNLHERNITFADDKFTINNRFPLIFFHFSGYDLNNPGVISKYQTRYSFDQRKDALPLFEDYRKRLLDNQFNKYSSLPCYYVKLKEKSQAASRTDKNVAVKSLAGLYKNTLKRILFRQ